MSGLLLSYRNPTAVALLYAEVLVELQAVGWGFWGGCGSQPGCSCASELETFWLQVLWPYKWGANKHTSCESDSEVGRNRWDWDWGAHFWSFFSCLDAQPENCFSVAQNGSGALLQSFCGVCFPHGAACCFVRNRLCSVTAELGQCAWLPAHFLHHFVLLFCSKVGWLLCLAAFCHVALFANFLGSESLPLSSQPFNVQNHHVVRCFTIVALHVVCVYLFDPACSLYHAFKFGISKYIKYVYVALHRHDAMGYTVIL